MINSIFDFRCKVNFEISLFELVKGLSIIVLFSVIVLVVKKIVSILKKEREIDKRVKQSSTRIARAVTEIEGYEKLPVIKKCHKEVSSTMPTKIESVIIDNCDLTIKEGVVSSIQEVSNQIQEEKKTRAMSREERWAEYDKKRAIRNTA